jgi:hypothetical protein
MMQLPAWALPALGVAVAGVGLFFFTRNQGESESSESSGLSGPYPIVLSNTVPGLGGNDLSNFAAGYNNSDYFPSLSAKFDKVLDLQRETIAGTREIQGRILDTSERNLTAGNSVDLLQIPFRKLTGTRSVKLDRDPATGAVSLSRQLGPMEMFRLNNMQYNEDRRRMRLEAQDLAREQRKNKAKK